jgi:hypothetical protein
MKQVFKKRKRKKEIWKQEKKKTKEIWKQEIKIRKFESQTKRKTNNGIWRSKQEGKKTKGKF